VRYAGSTPATSTTGKEARMSLTAKHRAFAREYLLDFNASAAAERAGYSPKTARQQGHRLLTNADVQATLAKGHAQAEEKALVTREEVIHGLRREAEYMDEGASHAARVSAWEKLGRHLAMFTDKHEHTFKRDPRELSDDELEAALADAGLTE